MFMLTHNVAFFRDDSNLTTALYRSFTYLLTYLLIYLLTLNPFWHSGFVKVYHDLLADSHFSVFCLSLSFGVAHAPSHASAEAGLTGWSNAQPQGRD